MKCNVAHIALVAICLIAALTGCEERLTDNPSDTVVFSDDTVFFDTVFTAAGSSTRRVMLRNPNKKAVHISSVRLKDGSSFIINFDGEQNPALLRSLDMNLAGGDSLFIFVRADIDPTGQDNPLFIEDRLLIDVGDHTEQLVLQAYGWDVRILDRHEVRMSTTFSADKPYLVRGYLLIPDGVTLTLPAGCHIFMHDTAQIACYGGLLAQGTTEKPVRILSDRLDNIFTDIPYLYVGGRWDGLYAVEPDTLALHNIEILSGNVGLYVLGSGKEHVTITNSRIHNHNLYGLVIQDADALVANTEISNCADYCVYLAGGRHEFVHTTIASYFNASRYAIQTTTRTDSISPLYINNLSKNRQPTELHFINSVLAGAQRNCLMIATPLPQYYNGEIAFSYLQTDTIHAPYAHDNTYGERGDTLFVNNFYSERNIYYDFRPDSASRALGIADPATAQQYPLDRLGNDRLADGMPDAGCYERTENQ